VTGGFPLISKLSSFYKVFNRGSFMQQLF